MVESVSSNHTSGSLPSNVNDVSAGGPHAPAARRLPSLRVTTEFDSDSRLFFNKVSCKFFDSLAKLKLSFHNNNKGHLSDPQLTFTSKHVSCYYDIQENNALINSSLEIAPGLNVTAAHNVREKVGEVTVAADLAPACKLELTSQLPSVAGLPKATLKFPYGEVSLEEYEDQGEEEEVAAPKLAVSALFKGQLLNGICNAQYMNDNLNLRYAYKDEQTTFIPSVSLPSNALSFAFKRRFSPSDKLRLNSNKISHNSKGDSKHKCLQILKLAIQLNVEFVEIDFELAPDAINELMQRRENSKIIVSTYLKSGVHCKEKLGNLLVGLQSTGADVIKVVTDVAYITDVAPVFHVLTHSQVPVIVRAVGDRGLISQLLGPKYGAFMVCGSIGGRSVPGLPPLLSLKNVYELDNVDVDTKVFGVVSNPVGHSKGPLLHNPAFRYCGYNGIYVPLLVDNIKEFLRVYSCADFAGFSIGLPHKEAAVACCDEVDPLAKSIGAVNTIIRRPTDGKLVGYNTDCDACITAIEDALQERQTSNGEVTNVSPIAGRLFVLVGAGGAGRALAFGAKSKGARVVIFNRNLERAQCLARAVSGEALPIEQLETYCPENGMILANCSAIGMEPDVHLTPVSKEHLRSYDLVFDAVYTPRNTRLLQEAAEVGVTIVSGVEMFIRQALGQFKLFTNGLAPEDFMRKVVLEQF